MKKYPLLLVLPLLLFIQACSSSPESKEIASDSKPTPSTSVDPSAPKTFTEADVKTAMEDFVRGHMNKDGSLDLKATEKGKLKVIKVMFVKLNDPVSLSSTSALACSEFKEAKKKKKKGSYDVCFWMLPGSDGRLAVQPEKAEIQRVNNKKLHDYDKSGNKVTL